MDLKLFPKVGASDLNFGMMRTDIRLKMAQFPLSTIELEPENDFYKSEGLILGYDGKDELEFIEIVPPSTASFEAIHFFDDDLATVRHKMQVRGHTAKLEDGSLNFRALDLALYCPLGKIESVAIYRDGYYDHS